MCREEVGDGVEGCRFGGGVVSYLTDTKQIYATDSVLEDAYPPQHEFQFFLNLLVIVVVVRYGL